MGHWQGKYVIGITGNIATGKSLVRKMLEHKGAYTIDADGLSHQVMAPGAPAYKPVIQWFGRWIVGSDKRIDRARLGAVAFSHSVALRQLEKITHPIISRAINTLINRSQHKIVVVEAIKLLEGDLADKVDTVWVVDSDQEVQLKRLMEKRGLSREDALRRIRVQNPQEEKITKASVVITNNGDAKETWAQVEDEWNKMLAALRGDTAPAEEAKPAATPEPAQPKQMAPQQPAAPAQPEQSTEAPAQPPAQPAPSGTPQAITGDVDVHRPKREDLGNLATLFNSVKGTDLSETDIMISFTETSYLVAEHQGKMIGAVGFVVENLITQSSDIVVANDVTLSSILGSLISAMEEASQSLQSEVSFIYLNPQTDAELINLLKSTLGYEEQEIEDISFTAWREAIRAFQPKGTLILSKKLREDRVLTPF